MPFSQESSPGPSIPLPATHPLSQHPFISSRVLTTTYHTCSPSGPLVVCHLCPWEWKHHGVVGGACLVYFTVPNAQRRAGMFSINIE